MIDNLNVIKNLPDISFIDNMTLEDAQNFLISRFQTHYQELTGKPLQLSKADPNRLILLSCAQLIYQGLQNVDKAGKMNFIKYAYGDFLKNLAMFKNVTAMKPKKATVKVKWCLSEVRETVTPIPAGSRVTANYDVYFETTEYQEIPIGKREIIVQMTCTVPGAEGNDFAPGELNIVVDPIGFIDSAVNIETSRGGSGEESDQSLAERTYLAPSSYSTAGPDDAYIYWAKNYDPLVGDVFPDSPTPGVVDIRFILIDGSSPDEAMIEGMEKHLQQRGKRPLTDQVIVSAPDAVPYFIKLNYYINSSDTANAASIQERAIQAVEEYKSWQCAKIGRDINPDELRVFLKKAGVKRIELIEPNFKILGKKEIAVFSGQEIIYGGLEDD